MTDFKFPGKINVIDVINNPDGSAKVTFEADEEFKEGFKKYYKLKRWSQKKFDKFLSDAISNMSKILKEDMNETESTKNNNT